MTNIAIFASGSGSNAQAIMDHFSHGAGAGKGIRLALLLSNNPQAYALERAWRAGVPASVFTREEFADSQGKVAGLLKEFQIDFIVLAGFLWLVPPYLTQTYNQHIVNVHPALLPQYGGRGMYGMRVHQAVIAAGEKESGITIHRVNEHYDEGDILFQARVPIERGVDTAETLAEKIHVLEHRHFPAIIEQTILGSQQ